jgi:transposase
MEKLQIGVTNKKAKGKKGAIIAIIARTKSEKVIHHLQRISPHKAKQVVK